jgi:hypothetical protein
MDQKKGLEESLKLRRVRDNIIFILNNSGLSSEAKRLIACEIMELATKTAEQDLKIAVALEEQNTKALTQEESEEEHDGLERNKLPNRQKPANGSSTDEGKSSRGKA